MPKQPAPGADALRAMREAEYEEALRKEKEDEAKAQTKPVRKRGAA